MRSDPSLLRRWTGVLLSALSLALSGACANRNRDPDGRATGQAPAAFDPDSEMGRAQSLAESQQPLPPRADTRALADRMETLGTSETSAVRATQLHTIAGRLLERLWRMDGRDEDAVASAQSYRSASQDASVSGACTAALRCALLLGDRARDASVTYTELFRVQKRFQGVPQPDAACLGDVQHALSLVAAFRPAQTVLDQPGDPIAIRGSSTSDADLQEGLPRPDPSLPPPSGPARIVDIGSWVGRDSARIVVTVDRPVEYRAGDETAPGKQAPQVFVDLDGVDLATSAAGAVSQGIVTRVYAETTSTGSRVLIELEQHAWRRIFQVDDPYRIVIDVARRGTGARGHRPRDVSRVVLDPGHGGRDTGATGPGGGVEKDVVLDIAHRVAPLLTEQGIAVLLTRDDDRYVPLEERAARANAFGADLFLSIHCNASEGKGRRGVETYVLDATRDEIAARVTARENQMTPAANAELGEMLGSMRLAEQAQQSARFATLLQRSALASLKLVGSDVVDGGVHFAGFYVLVGARMPSVLFETSYISNPVEEERLASAEYRQGLADSIANAVKAYREGR